MVLEHAVNDHRISIYNVPLTWHCCQWRSVLCGVGIYQTADFNDRALGVTNIDQMNCGEYHSPGYIMCAVVGVSWS